MRVLGVDPGTVSLGYAVVDFRDEMRVVDCGVLRLPSRIPVEERLQCVYRGLGEVIAKHKPSEAAIEEPFVGRNVRSAFSIGRAQAVAILSAVGQGLPVYYYSPAQVKQQITSYGRGDKEQVREMVRIQLGLSSTPEPSDATDALAVAVCHIQQSRVNQWLAERT